MALVDQLGDLQFIVGSASEPEMVIYGNICCDAVFDPGMTGQRYLRSGSDQVALKAALQNGRLVGEFAFRGDHTFTLASNPSYRRLLTLQTLAGVYTHTDTPIFGSPSTLTMAITANGDLTGSHSNGCTYAGRVAIADTAYNMVRMDVEVSGCGTRISSSPRWNGKYRGLGTLRSSSGSPTANVFYQSLVGPTWLGDESLTR